MTPTETTILLSDIVAQVDCELIDEADSCEGIDIGQIVERVGGKLYIVDGFHRTAGQARHCRDNEIDTDSHRITVVLACEDDSDNDLVAAAAEPGVTQDAAIAEIYRLAGR